MVEKKNRSNLTKTRIFNGKRYYVANLFDTKALTNAYIKKFREDAKRHKTQFFIIKKEYIDANGKNYFAVYWRI